MTKRAEQALRGLYDPAANPAIGKLVEFAAQNPGLEYGNYGNWKAFSSERASITRDWKRLKKALYWASVARVTDKDVIEAAPRAFSGRLEWITTEYNASKEPCPSCGAKPHGYHLPECSGGVSGHWAYTTEYFPTEYRKAAATVLEYATRAVKQAREPVRGNPQTMAAVKHLNELNGGCWFDEGTMRFFGTKVESEVLHGRYFISSEQPPHGSRKFTVRSFDDHGAIDTVGEFCAYHNKADAIEALEEHLAAATV